MDDSDEEDEEDFKFSRPGSKATPAVTKKPVPAPVKPTPVPNKPAATGGKAGQKKSLFDSDSDEDY